MHDFIPRPGLGAEDDDEGCVSPLSLVLAFLLIAVVAVGSIFGAAYFMRHIGISGLLRGIGLAVFLPAWRDHHADDRQEWIREQGEGPHVVERWTFRLCLVAFAVLMVSGYFGGAA